MKDLDEITKLLCETALMWKTGALMFARSISDRMHGEITELAQEDIENKGNVPLRQPQPHPEVLLVSYSDAKQVLEK